MNKVISLDKYRKIRYNQDLVDMKRAFDELYQEALRVGLCPECGGLYGLHLTYCPENGKKIQT